MCVPLTKHSEYPKQNCAELRLAPSIAEAVIEKVENEDTTRITADLSTPYPIAREHDFH